MTVNTDLAGPPIGIMRNAVGLPGLEYARRPEPMHGGFWAELFSFSLANPPDGWPAELVVRLMPDPGTARKESIVQSAVAAAGFPTPSVRASGGPDCGLGLAFMVMDKAAGGPALCGLDGGLTPAALPRLLRQLPELLAGSMARLHALDPDLVRGELGQVRDVPVTVAGLLVTAERFAGEFGRPDLVRAIRWLTDHRFLRRYQRQTATTIGSGELRWYQGVACMRALVEMAGWVHEGVADARAGHPWLVSGPAFARRLTALTGAPVRARLRPPLGPGWPPSPPFMPNAAPRRPRQWRGSDGADVPLRAPGSVTRTGPCARGDA